MKPRVWEKSKKITRGMGEGMISLYGAIGVHVWLSGISHPNMFLTCPPLYTPRTPNQDSRIPFRSSLLPFSILIHMKLLLNKQKLKKQEFIKFAYNFSLAYTVFSILSHVILTPTQKHVFNGHIVTDDHSGDCFCSNFDKYCLCTPSLAIDVVVVNAMDQILTVKRNFPPVGSALPGGFVNIGESVEEAAIRELNEETGLTITVDDLSFIPKIFSAPKRDQRRHTASVCYKVEFNESMGKPKAGDDAKEVKFVARKDLHLQFDHEAIVAYVLRI